MAVYKVVNAQKSIYAVTKASMIESLTLNFTISVKTFNGVILNSFDSRGNVLEISVVVQVGDDMLRVCFNTSEKMASLKHICGCDPCGDREMNFYVQLKQVIINITCNHRLLNSLSLSQSDNSFSESDDHHRRPIPVLIDNKNDSIFLIMGNSGPYTSNKGQVVPPSKEHLIGCLAFFFINNTRIYFNISGSSNKSDMLPSCHHKCSDNICNNGTCKETSNGVVCDCTNTVFNGLYCNKSLVMYTKGVNNSYVVSKHATYIYLKFTWRQLISKKYCLLEIINGNKSFILSTNNNQLIFNNTVISNFDLDIINVVSISITNNILTFKIINYYNKFEFPMNEYIRINVGFSERNYSCEVFEWAYDVHFESKVCHVTSTLPYQRDPQFISKAFTVYKTTQIFDGQRNEYIYIVIICVGLMSLFTVMIITLYAIVNRQMISKLKNFDSSVSVASRRQDLTVSSDVGVYGLVEDMNTYDYIV